MQNTQNSTAEGQFSNNLKSILKPLEDLTLENISGGNRGLSNMDSLSDSSVESSEYRPTFDYIVNSLS
ncbi:MAG: hypothetical protein AAGE59_18845 [Cyanobacteria bacterium P01_F01_bin.86]